MESPDRKEFLDYPRTKVAVGSRSFIPIFGADLAGFHCLLTPEHSTIRFETNLRLPALIFLFLPDFEVIRKLLDQLVITV